MSLHQARWREGMGRSRVKEEAGRTGGNKRGDVTEGSGFFFFGFLLESFSLFLGLFSAFFPPLSSSPSLGVLVNNAVCVQTPLWCSPPSPSCPLPLSFLPLPFSGEIKAHTVTALTISLKNPPLQKSSKLPASRPGPG